MKQEESDEGRTFLYSPLLLLVLVLCWGGCVLLLHGGGSRDLKGPLVIFGLNDEVSRGDAGILRSKLDQKVRALFAIQTPFGRFDRPIARRCVRSKARPKIRIAHEGILEIHRESSQWNRLFPMRRIPHTRDCGTKKKTTRTTTRMTRETTRFNRNRAPTHPIVQRDI